MCGCVLVHGGVWCVCVYEYVIACVSRYGWVRGGK